MVAGMQGVLLRKGPPDIWIQDSDWQSAGTFRPARIGVK